MSYLGEAQSDFVADPANQNINGEHQFFALQGRISRQVTFFITGLVREDSELIQPSIRFNINPGVSEQHQQAVDLM